MTRFKSKIRYLALANRWYIRFYPNPGFQLGPIHWCVACRWCKLGPSQVRGPRTPRP